MIISGQRHFLKYIVPAKEGYSNLFLSYLLSKEVNGKPPLSLIYSGRHSGTLHTWTQKVTDKDALQRMNEVSEFINIAKFRKLQYLW